MRWTSGLMCWVCLAACGCAQIFGIEQPNEVPAGDASAEGSVDATTQGSGEAGDAQGGADVTRADAPSLPDGPQPDSQGGPPDAPSNEGSSNDAADASQAPDAGASDADASDGYAPITGKQSHFFIPDDINSAVEVPVDFTSVPIAAYVPQPDGGVTKYPGTGNGAGQFTIPGVPAGATYYVKVDARQADGTTRPVYAFETKRALDLSDAFLGRSNVQYADGGGTLQIDVSGAVPFGPNDSVNLQALNANDVEYTWQTPIPGTTDYSTAWQEGQGLIQPTDTVWIVQMHSDSADATVPQTLVRYVQTSGVTTANGQLTVIDAGFVAPPQVPMSLMFDHGSFTQYVNDVFPNGTILFSYLAVDALPMDPTVGLGLNLGGNVDMFILSLPTNGGIETYDASYGDPFPGAWSRVVQVGIEVQGSIAVTLPDGGSSNPASTPGGIGCTYSLADFAGGKVVQSLLSPVLQPLVNQGSFHSNRSGIGLTPTLSWTPPTAGPPTAYEVQVRQVTVDASNQARVATIALLTTGATSVTVPPGILQMGQTYQFDVLSVLSRGDDETRPLYVHLPRCGASVQSGVMSP